MDRYVEARRKAKNPNSQKRTKQKGVKDATISRELTDIKAILNWSARRRPPLIPFNPVRDYQKPVPEPTDIIPPTPSEVARIYEAASPHLKRAILTSYYCGLRPGAVELLSINWNQVNLETGYIYVDSAKKGQRNGVQKKRRIVPIHADFLPQLVSWQSADEIIGAEYLIHYRGKPIKKLQTTWANTLRRAKITRRIRPYDLRHHFVTSALEEGADIGALSQVVGSKPETLRKFYQHVSDRLQREVVDKISTFPLPGFEKEDI